MKILYITSLYAPNIVGGAEISTQFLVETMQRAGNEVVVLTTTDKSGFHKEIINNVLVYRAEIKNIYWHYKSKPTKSDKIRWHIKDMYNKAMQDYVKEVLDIEKPDIVSCHNLPGWSVAIWDAIHKAKIPIVQVLHDFYLLCMTSNMFKNDKQCDNRCLQCKAMRYIHQKKSQKVNAVVGISQYILDKVIDAGYFRNSIKTVIYNGRNILEVSPNKVQLDDTSNIVFGFIGALAPNKGVRWMVEEFKGIESDRITLKIAGRGNSAYEKELKYLSQSDSRISFMGSVNSNDFYSQIDVLIVPSIWEEPLGMVAIEACANNIPVITTGTGGLKEIITDGYNGLFCDWKKNHSLGEAMKNILSNRDMFETLKMNTRKSVSRFLDKERLIQEYKNIYTLLKR